MDPQQPSLQSKNKSRSHDTTSTSTFGSGAPISTATSSTGTTTSASATTTTSATTTAATLGNTSSGLIGSIVASARNAAATLDPRQADVLRQHHSFGGSSGSPGSSSSQGGIGSSSSKTTTSSASRTFQHTTNALETLGSSNSGGSSRDAGSGSGYSLGFRQTTAPMPSTASTGGMDWDNFLASSDSTIQEDTPYKPPSMASFGFSALSNPEPVSATRQDHLPQQLQQLSQQQHQQRHQFPEGPQSAFQAHLSQPMNLTPANHAAFLEYLKSTAHPTTTTTTTTQSSAPSSTTTATPISLASATRPPPQFQYQPSPHQHTSNYYPASTARPLFSNDIQHQQHLDGSDVLAFLDSTSYSEFVDEVEAAGIEKHQQERREFVYSDEAGLGPAGGRHTRSIFSTLQLIQHLPSERQDIVQYLLQQGTYAEDVWSRPFGHDGQREEAASMAATQAEQDLFLQQQYQRKQQQQGDGDSEEGTDDATTEEMERVMKQIVENATEEVKTGQTDGRALNRLLMVRSHITMGTKL